MSLVYASIFGYFQKMNPILKWKSLRNASLMLQSEIYKFRMLSCEYQIQNINICVLPYGKLHKKINEIKKETIDKGAIKEGSLLNKYSKDILKHEQYAKNNYSNERLVTEITGGDDKELNQKQENTPQENSKTMEEINKMDRKSRKA